MSQHMADLGFGYLTYVSTHYKFALLHISPYKYLFANVNISSRIHATVNLEISHNKLLIKLIIKICNLLYGSNSIFCVQGSLVIFNY
jgi:hypothetical protein